MDTGLSIMMDVIDIRHSNIFYYIQIINCRYKSIQLTISKILVILIMYRQLYRGWMMSFLKSGKNNIPLNKTGLTNQKNSNQKFLRNDRFREYDNTRYTKKVKVSNKINLQLQQPLQVDQLNEQLSTQQISQKDPYQDDEQIEIIHEEQNYNKPTNFEQNAVTRQKIKKHRQKLLKLLDYTENKLTKTIVAKLLQKSSAESNITSRELFTALDFQNKIRYNSFESALFIIGLFNSPTNFKIYKQRSFIFFFSIYFIETYMFYTRQGTNSIEIKPLIYKNMKKEQKDLIFNQVLKHFPQFYMLIRARHEKNRFKCGMFNLLTQLQGQKLQFETINRILDVLVLVLFQQDSQIDKFKATRIFNNVISNFIANVESQPDIVKNLSMANLNFRQFHHLTKQQYYQMLSSERKSNYSQKMIHLIVKIAKTLKLAGCYQHEDIKKFINIIVSDDLYANQSNYTLFKFYTMMLKAFITEVDQNGNNPIIEKIKRSNLTNFEKKQNFKASYIRDSGFFFQLMRFKFYKHYIMLKSETIQGHIVIKQKPTTPPLDDFEIKYFQEHESQIINYTFFSMKIMMNTLYPEIMIKKELTQQNLSQNKKKNQNLKDNQIVGRLGQAISKLNIQYQRQVRVLGSRNVDFLLKKNIIVQCDGDIHIDFSTLNVNCATAYRNLSLMLCGYRIIAVCMSEINENRDSQKLQELLKKKLKILQENNAYLVQ